MNYLRLPPFSPVANGTRATVQVPRYDMTIGRVILRFGGSINIANISEIVVKIGPRVVFGPVSGNELVALNKFKGLQDRSDALTIDWTERDALTVVAKEIGGIDIPALGGEDVFIEVVNTASTGTPTLYGLIGFTGLQFDPRKPAPDGQLIKKVIPFNVPSTGGTRLTWAPNFKGAIIQRVHFLYSGANWTTSANGNLQTVEVKKNGVAVFDSIQCLDWRYVLQEHRKAPAGNQFHVDFVHDNVHSAALSTADARSLEFNLQLGAADTIKAIVECLDVPGNL